MKIFKDNTQCKEVYLETTILDRNTISDEEIEEALECGGVFPIVAGIPCVAVSDDDSMVATGSNSAVHLWTKEYGNEKILEENYNTLPMGGETRSLYFSKDGNYLGELCNDNNTIHDVIQIWDVSTPNFKLTAQLESENYEDEEDEHYPFLERSMEFIKISNDSSFVLTSPWSSEIYVYNINLEPLKKLKGHTHIVKDVLFSKDSNSFISWDEMGHACMWELKSFKLLKNFKLIENMLDAFFSEDDKTLFCVTSKGLFSWSMEQEKMVEVLYMDSIKKAIVSKDKKYMATHNGKIITLWDFEKRKKLYEINNGDITINDMAFHLNNRLLFVTENFRLKVWSIESSEMYLECREEKEYSY